MSEPYSAVAQVTIERSRLIAYLDAVPTPARTWHDWARIGGDWYGFSWERDLPLYVDIVDRRLAGSYRHVIGHLIEPDILPGTERCPFEPAARRFTFATLMIAENLEELLLFFAAARGIASYVGADDAGFVMVLDYLWSKPPSALAVMQIGPTGHSQFLDVRSDASARYLSEATAVFDDIKDRGGDPRLVVNNLDALR